MKQLSVKREAFLQAFIKCGNASEAYRTAFNAKNMKAETIHRKAAELMKDGKVTARLAELQAALQKRHEVTVDRVVQEYAKLAFSNMLDYVTIDKDGGAFVDLSALTRDQAAAIQEVIVDHLPARPVDGEGGDEERKVPVLKTRFKLADKRGALDSLPKHLGVFEKDNQQQGDAMAKAMSDGAVNDRAIARAILDIFRTANVG